MSDALFRAPRRRRGPIESALDRTLVELARRDAPGTAADEQDLRSALRRLAMLADGAVAGVAAGESRYVAVQAVTRYLDKRLEVLPLEREGVGDDLDDELRAFMRAESGDTP